MHSNFFSWCFLFGAVVAYPNLLTEGQRGRILGSSFGVPGVNGSYDYVIVGGGTAGLTVAARLAENPSLSIAVVEAGGFYELDNGNLSVVPALAVFFAGTDPKDTQPLVDWGFVTTPQAVSTWNSNLADAPTQRCMAGSEQSHHALSPREDLGGVVGA
jgi:choline dehydrogenase